ILLSDSNLPTGFFVASSGSESSWIQWNNTSNHQPALPFVSDAHRVVQGATIRELQRGWYFRRIQELDELYNVMPLKHVTKRASKFQGVALLTLYTKGSSIPLHRHRRTRPSCARTFQISICRPILTGALGLTLERSQYLHIFLHACFLLSAIVRLNEIGPYNAQQILLHVSLGIINAEMDRCEDLRSSIHLNLDSNRSKNSGYFYNGPTNKWPLGETLGARHDLKPSGIFNSWCSTVSSVSSFSCLFLASTQCHPEFADHDLSCNLTLVSTFLSLPELHLGLRALLGR
ncbi:uncharacterized protein C8R40DRAFT_1054411, partial [Lentinula edodes]|uniref:uncharacterized protein n=1 Tax=Lentinula edodes TaxID=5353 RepID=UPI001E8CD37B